MFGVAGIVTVRPIERQASAIAIADSLAHCGPDDSGAWSDPGIVLAHRRISIIDSSPAGYHPMVPYHGRYVMVYSGETYSYVELHTRVEKRGVAFRVHSDSKVLPEAFALDGPACLDRLNGMWALGIWDTPAQRLFIARDRFGEKPFYHTVVGNEFLFASEIKALLASGLVVRRVNPRAVADFAAERVSDHTAETFFVGVSQLRPAHYGWRQDGRLTTQAYWRLPPNRNEPPAPHAAEEIGALVEASVRLRTRLRADTPVGTLLSGGVDSSGVTCLAARAISSRISAFSTIDRIPPEEAKGIELVRAMYPAIDFHRDQPGSDTLDTELDACLWRQEAPSAGGSMFAHFRIMRLARESSVRVLLTGQAADEVFAGYPGHLAVHLGGLISAGDWFQARTFTSALRSAGQRVEWHSALGYALPQQVASMLRRKQSLDRVDWLIPAYRATSTAVSQGYARQHGDPLNDALRSSLTQRTLPGLLHYEDRNSMAFGVETRIPFLDHRLVEKTLPHPGATKLNGARTKALLRDARRNDVPQPIVARLKKQGHPAPLARWLREGIPDKRAGRMQSVRSCPLIDFTHWQRRYRRFVRGDDVELPAVWRGMILAPWHARFIEGAA